MKIEQIEINKIQVIFSKEELEKNNINLNMLMSNSQTTQNLFLSILDIAEKEIGFKTKNYDIAIETLVLNNNNFILTISRKNTNDNLTHKKLIIHRKSYNNLFTYKFSNFDDFYDFFDRVKFSSHFNKSLYYFNSNFYYIYNNKNTPSTQKIISEYALPCRLPSELIKNYGKQIL